MACARRRKRRPRFQPALAVLGIVLLAMIAYGVALPIAEFSQRDPDRLLGSLHEHMRLRSLEAFAVVWFFFFGACIGSFLNVVIYRVPRGHTLLGSSRCPYCGHDIRMRHNIPVLGWLLLRGRCRDCRLPISPRYPIVEIVVGGVFLTLALIELFSGGRNLPVRTPNHLFGVPWIIFQPQWDLLRLYGLHCGVLGVLLSWALIWYDRQRVPVAYGAGVLAAVLLLPVVDPGLQLVHWRWPHDWPLSAGEALLSAMIGAVSGGLVGTLTWIPHIIMDWGYENQQSRAARGALCFALAGAIVGWQTVLSIAWLVPLLRLLLHLLLARAAPRLAACWPLAFFCSTWLQICAWKWLADIPAWPSHKSPLLIVPIQLVAAVLLSACVSRWCDASEAGKQ